MIPSGPWGYLTLVAAAVFVAEIVLLSILSWLYDDQLPSLRTIREDFRLWRGLGRIRRTAEEAVDAIGEGPLRR